MLYTNEEMKELLLTCLDIEEDTIDLVTKLMGDTPQTYIKILSAISKYKNFYDLDNDLYTEQDGIV